MLMIIDTFSFALYIAMTIILISNFYSFQEKLKLRVPLCLGVILLRTVVNVYFYHVYLLKLICFFGGFIICTKVLLKCDKCKFLILDALCASVAYFSETVCMLIVASMKHQSLYELAGSDDIKMSLYFLNLTVTLAVYYLIDMIIKRRKFVIIPESKKIRGYELISFIVTIALEVIIIDGLARIFNDEQLNTFLIIFSVIFCALNTGLYFVFCRLAKAHEIDCENQLMKQQSQMQLKAYEGLSEQYHESLKIVHDMRKHIRSLDSLIENSSDKSVLEYQKMMYQQLDQISPSFTDDNTLLAVIINNALLNARKNNIVINLNIEKVNLDFISPIDMTTIFCNLIDNAIEACSELSENRKIQVSIVKQMNYITVHIRNQYQTINFVNDEFHTTKKGHLGIGIDNVRQVLEKYNGKIKIKTDNNLFAVTVLIPEIK